MTASHTHRDIPNWKRSFALLSESEASTAVVFVHGFNGSTRNTFSDFQGLIDVHGSSLGWWTQADLYFFSYKSVTNHISTSSEDFQKFLAGIFPRPQRELFLITQQQYPWLNLRDDIYVSKWPRTYTSLVLVGHSEGAVVIRRMLCDIIQKKTTKESILQDAVLNSKLKLFAPAIFGAKLSGLWGLLLKAPFLGMCGDAFLQWSRAARTLIDTSAASFLAILQEEIKQCKMNYPALGASNAEVVFGDKDDVVTPTKWFCDHNLENERGHSHTSICKPEKKTQYFLPIEFVSKDRP